MEIEYSIFDQYLHRIFPQPQFIYSLNQTSLNLSITLPEINIIDFSHHFALNCYFKDTLEALDDFKTSSKSVWSNVFWYVKV